MKYFTICFILDLQEHIYNKKTTKIGYMSADFSGRHVVTLGDLSIDHFLEVNKNSQVKHVILYILLLMGSIYDIESTCLGIFPNIPT